MGLTRASILRGPAKIVYDSTSFWTPDDIAVDYDPGFVDVKSSMFGPRLDALVVNPKITVTFTPHMFSTTGPATPAQATVSGVLVPSIFLNGYFGTAYIGAGNEKTLTIWASSGEQIVIKNAVITKPPTLTYAADKPIFGPVTVTGICCTTSSDIVLGANALFDESTGASDPGLAAVGVPSYLQKRYKCVVGTLTGFTEMFGENGWSVEFNPSWKERMIQGLTVDYELTGMEIIVKGVPTGPTMAQALTLFAIGGDGGATWLQGALMTGQQSTHDITIVDPTGPTTVFSLRKPVIRALGTRFGYETLRLSELSFHATLRLNAGAALPLAAFGAFA